jgi:hypothetical protein
MIYSFFLSLCKILDTAQNTGVLISPQPEQEGNKLQRQKILIYTI